MIFDEFNMKCIEAKYNPALGLRSSKLRGSKTKGVEDEDCLPSELKPGEKYEFRKRGRRLFALDADVPLFETGGHDGFIGPPKALVTILEYTHYIDKDSKFPMTCGFYRVETKVSPDDLEALAELYERCVRQ